MRLFIYCLTLIFCLFPYTQIVKLDSYTQPYALLLSIAAAMAAHPTLRHTFPKKDAIALISLAGMGIIGFLISCMPNPDPQEVKYLIIYISPFFFAVAGFAIATEHPKATDRIAMAAAATWIAVGVIQTFIAPGFASQFAGGSTEAAEIVVDSGRGTLGLAPEPTHFGFHMIVLAAAVVLAGGRNWLSIACLVTAILIARSSSAVLALSLGAVIYLTIFGKKARFLVLLVIPLYFLLGTLLENNALPENVRLVVLLKEFYHDPFYMITSDTSANARLGGIYVGAGQIISQMFAPAGLATNSWTSLIGPLLAENPWLIVLSEAGIPSGVLIVIFQLGFLGIIPLFYILGRMMTGLFSYYETFLVCAMVFVFFSQYMISTPGFGLIYGLILARKMAAERYRTKAPLPTRLTVSTNLALAR